jgi:hypothetical protein
MVTTHPFSNLYITRPAGINEAGLASIRAATRKALTEPQPDSNYFNDHPAKRAELAASISIFIADALELGDRAPRYVASGRARTDIRTLRRALASRDRSRMRVLNRHSLDDLYRGPTISRAQFAYRWIIFPAGGVGWNIVDYRGSVAAGPTSATNARPSNSER